LNPRDRRRKKMKKRENLNGIGNYLDGLHRYNLAGRGVAGISDFRRKRRR